MKKESIKIFKYFCVFALVVEAYALESSTLKSVVPQSSTTQSNILQPKGDSWQNLLRSTPKPASQANPQSILQPNPQTNSQTNSQTILNPQTTLSPTSQSILQDATTQADKPKNTFLHKTKAHFFSPRTYKERAQKAQDSYKYYMQIFEHEGTYFLFYHSFTPVWGINDRNELKFQLSAKIPIWRGAFWSKGSLFFGYTQTMWFQQFNFRYSSPVRDTDYKPSIFYSYPVGVEILGGRLEEVRFGFLHYSNGIGGEECRRESFEDPTPSDCRSRSAANRLMLEAIWERDFGNVKKQHNLGVHISAWPYIQQRKDNIDLPEYMGYANIKLYYKHSRHLAEVHFTPLLADYARYHASVRLGYAFGLNDFTSLYVQYFYGYGDNLYEYNHISHRLGIGLRVRSF